MTTQTTTTKHLDPAYRYIVHFPQESYRLPCVTRTYEEAVEQATYRTGTRYSATIPPLPGIVDAYHNPTPFIEAVDFKSPTILQESPLRYHPLPLVFLAYDPRPNPLVDPLAPLQDVVIITQGGVIEGGYSRTPLSVLKEEAEEKGTFLPFFLTANASGEWDAQRYTTPPKQITRDEFWEALECLPPENWRTTGDGESFRSCEYLTGNITSHYVHIGGTYWSFTAPVTSHENAIAKVIVARNLKLCKDKQVPV